MEIKFYSMQCEKNKINKTSYLLNEYICEGHLVDGTSYIRPSIRIQIGNFGYNYAIIPAFGRAYFVDNITVERTGIFLISLVVDVLYTYRNDILMQNVFLDRTNNANYITEKIPDDYALFSNSVNIEKILPDKSIPGLNEDYFYFVVAIVSPNEPIPVAGWHSSYKAIGYPTDGMFGKNSFISYYILSYPELSILSRFCYGNSEFTSYIVDIKCVPFDYKDFGVRDRADITFNGETVISGVTILGQDAHEGFLLLSDDLNISLYIEDDYFYSLNPYASYFIFLPFYGLLELRSEYIVGQKVKLDCAVNFYTSEISYAIYTVDEQDKFKFLINSITCDFGVSIPVSSTNMQEIKRAKDTAALGNFASVLASGFVAIAGIVTANPVAAIAGIGGFIGSIFGGAGKIASIPDPSASTKNYGGSNSFAALPYEIYIYKISKKRQNTVNDYNDIIGQPSGKKVQLSTLNENDVFSVAEMHLNRANSSITSTFYATSQELDEIITKLKTFCIK